MNWLYPSWAVRVLDPGIWLRIKGYLITYVSAVLGDVDSKLCSELDDRCLESSLQLQTLRILCEPV